jgi:hypothetical protein
MVNKKLLKEAEETIETFKQKFYGKYGVWPIVTFPISEPKLKVNSFAEAEEIVNTIMNKKEGHTHKLRDRVRMRSVVEYRQVLFKILFDLGYTCTSIGQHFGYDHATVICPSKFGVSSWQDTDRAAEGPKLASLKYVK